MATNIELELAFVAWADRIVAEGGDVAGYNFNLYEHEGAWAVQLVGTVRLDAEDVHWACDEIFSSVGFVDGDLEVVHRRKILNGDTQLRDYRCTESAAHSVPRDVGSSLHYPQPLWQVKN